jgi:hypothetical protein
MYGARAPQNVIQIGDNGIGVDVHQRGRFEPAKSESPIPIYFSVSVLIVAFWPSSLPQV